MFCLLLPLWHDYSNHCLKNSRQYCQELMGHNEYGISDLLEMVQRHGSLTQGSLAGDWRPVPCPRAQMSNRHLSLMWSEPPQGYRYPCSWVVQGTESPFSTLRPWLSFWRIFRGFVENIHSNPNRKSLPGSRQPLGGWFSWCLEETSQG